MKKLGGNTCTRVHVFAIHKASVTVSNHHCITYKEPLQLVKKLKSKFKYVIHRRNANGEYTQEKTPKLTNHQRKAYSNNEASFSTRQKRQVFKIEGRRLGPGHGETTLSHSVA